MDEFDPKTAGKKEIVAAILDLRTRVNTLETRLLSAEEKIAASKSAPAPVDPDDDL